MNQVFTDINFIKVIFVYANFSNICGAIVRSHQNWRHTDIN